MKRAHVQTDFIKFILEKYSNQGQGLPDEDEIDIPNDENEESQLRKRKTIKKFEDDDDGEIVQGEEETEETDDEIIDELLNEYKRLKKKYEKKYESNRIRVRRKR